MVSFGTLILEGKLKGVSVLALVDSGSSINLISPKVAATLELHVNPSCKMNVRVADGRVVSSRGLCEDTCINFGNIDVRIDAHVFDLSHHALDLILGVPSLRTLGKVVMNWVDMTMSFLHNGVYVELKGKLNNAVVSPPHIELNRKPEKVLARKEMFEGEQKSKDKFVVLKSHFPRFKSQIPSSVFSDIGPNLNNVAQQNKYPSAIKPKVCGGGTLPIIFLVASLILQYIKDLQNSRPEIGEAQGSSSQHTLKEDTDPVCG